MIAEIGDDRRHNIERSLVGGDLGRWMVAGRCVLVGSKMAPFKPEIWDARYILRDSELIPGAANRIKSGSDISRRVGGRLWSSTPQ